MILLSACPPGGQGTSAETGSTESDATTETTGGGAEASVTEPTTNQPTVATTETEATSGSMSGTESQGGTDSTTDTSGPTSTTTTNPDCKANADCQDEAPFCENNKCVSCSGAAEPDVACAGLDGGSPVCADGVCVECSADNAALCTGSTPVCGEGNACTACTQHAECADSACNLETGGCFALEYVLYVDRTAACEGALGTMEAPFCKIGDALSEMQQDLAVGWTVKIKGGNYLEEPLVVPDGATAVLTRWGDTSPKIRALDDSGATLTIQNASKVFLDRLAFNSNDSAAGVVCGNANVWLDDTRIAGNKGQGYESTDCTSRINRSVIFDNDGGGVASYGAGTTHIINSYISGNGTQNGGDYGGIRSAQGNELHLIYSTVVNNLSAQGPRTLQCVEAGPAEVRNSVLIGFGLPSVDCPTAEFTTSAVDEGIMDGDSNLLAVQMDIMNFFQAPSAGVYAALADTAIATLAVWKEGDPKTDFNGTPRANMDGATDYAGADKP
jgi:hypothetical protein